MYVSDKGIAPLNPRTVLVPVDFTAAARFWIPPEPHCIT